MGTPASTTSELRAIDRHRLRLLMDYQRLNQTALANAAGIHRSTVSRWFSTTGHAGSGNPDAVAKVAAALGVTVGDFTYVVDGRYADAERRQHAQWALDLEREIERNVVGPPSSEAARREAVAILRHHLRRIRAT